MGGLFDWSYCVLNRDKTLTKVTPIYTLAGQMANALPLRFDPVLFAKRGRRFAGNIAAGDLPRIIELAPHAQSDIHVTMSFSVSSLQFPMVRGTIEGEIMQTCQRCLGLTRTRVNSRFELLLVTCGASELASQEGHEVFEYSGQFVSTAALIEDEIILSLPIVARHEDVAACDASARQWTREFSQVPASDKRDHPFAKLKDLKF